MPDPLIPMARILEEERETRTSCPIQWCTSAVAAAVAGREEDRGSRGTAAGARSDSERVVETSRRREGKARWERAVAGERRPVNSTKPGWEVKPIERVQETKLNASAWEEGLAIDWGWLDVERWGRSERGGEEVVERRWTLALSPPSRPIVEGAWSSEEPREQGLGKREERVVSS